MSTHRLTAFGRHSGAALALFALVALAAIYPVVPHATTHVIGWPGDNVPFVYLIGHLAQALWLGQPLFVDPILNYPDQLLLTATDIPYVSILAVAPVTWLLGPVFSYNLLVWLNLCLSGFFAYLWITQSTGSRAAALIAGLAFLLTPYRIVHSYGHLQMVSTYALPLFFWALDSAMRRPVPTRRSLLLLAGATFLVGSSSQYYMIICLVVGAFYGLFMVLPRPIYLLRYGWQVVLSVGVGTVAGALPYLGNLGNVSYVTFDPLATRKWSADPVNFLLPSRLHPLWGSFIDETIRPEPLWIEKTLYISMVAGGLALLALCWPRHTADRLLNNTPGTAFPAQRWVWAGVALVGALFALGIDLHINNQPVQPDNPILLPAYYLTHLPFVSLMRSWARFGIIPILFVALLAGLGAALLLHRLHRWRWLVATALCVLLCIDLLPGRVEISPLTPRPVDVWLAEQPGDFAVGYLPIYNSNIVYPAMYGSLLHGKRMPAFAHRTHQTTAYHDFARRTVGFPEAESVAQLRELGLRYVILEKQFFDGNMSPAWDEIAAQLAQSPDVYIVTEVGNSVVVGFRP